MNEAMFISYAQNLEDVMLWRALRHVEAGFYIDVGAWDPVTDSVTKAFYDAGWHGVNLEPAPVLFERLRAGRNRDINLQLAAAAEASEKLTLFLLGENTGLNTIDADIAGLHAAQGQAVTQLTIEASTLAAVCETHAPENIHFLKIDVEGAELAVLQGADFRRWRPWIIVIEATLPNSPAVSYHEWEPLLLQQDYRFVYFDGLNRFYVAQEREAELAPAFDRPPNWFDRYIRFSEFELRQKYAKRLAFLQGDRFPESALSKGRLELDDRLVFMHITKTAGTSVHHAIAKMFPPEEIFTAYDGYFRAYPRERLKGYRYFSGHAGIKAFRCVPKPFKIVTFLRHPVDRLVSAYEYHTSYKDEAVEAMNLHETRYCKTLSLKECLSPGREIQFSFQWNPYLGCLVGDGSVIEQHNRSGLDQELLDRALQVLDTMNFVGIAEDLKTSFELLSSALDIPNYYAGEMLNVTRNNKIADSAFTDPAKIDFTAELMELIHDRIALDMVLYRHAVSRLFGELGVARTYVGSPGNGGRLRAGKNGSWIESTDDGGFLLMGPYARLFPGKYRADFRLRYRPATPESDIDLGTLDVVGQLASCIFAARSILTSDFHEDHERTMSLDFEISQTCHDVEFRVRKSGAGDLSVACEVRIYDRG